MLLLRGSGIVKTIKFKDPVYLGDCLNAVKIFNEKEVDELIIVDYKASLEEREPDLNRINEIASECFMPLVYGGGISSFEHAKNIFNQGVEKVIINSNSVNYNLISRIASVYGNQSVVISIDAKKNLMGKYGVYTHSGNYRIKTNLKDHLKNILNAGAGEIFLQSIDHDGTMKGYDIELLNEVKTFINVPLILAGGAGKISDFDLAFDSGANAVAAGSMFVFKGRHKAVLINYPEKQ